MPQTAVVTGGGSGVGRAIALGLAREGWNVAIAGRQEKPLLDTVALAGPGAAQILPVPCDIADPEAVAKLAERVLAQFKTVEAVVNAAGTNVPRRSLEVLTPGDFRRVIDVNFNGAFYVTQAFLPAMRRQKQGTIVHIVSDAGLVANAKAGPAYVMSKFGVVGLTQSINAEERGNGIRAIAICPGDINTPLLDRRPAPPPPEAREKMLQPADIAACALLAINLPPRAIIELLLVRPR